MEQSPPRSRLAIVLTVLQEAVLVLAVNPETDVHSVRACRHISAGEVCSRLNVNISSLGVMTTPTGPQDPDSDLIRAF